MKHTQFYILTIVVCIALVSCGDKPKGASVGYIVSPKSELSRDPELSKPAITFRMFEKPEQKGYFKIGYDDGYEDGDHLEKGRSYKKNIPDEWKSEYRQGYFAGYADGRAVADPSDDYFTGNNNTDYFDLSDDVYEGDDDDWSDEEDW